MPTGISELEPVGTQPRTTLLPPAPRRHHWCVVIPPSALPHFDDDHAEARLHRALVEQLWERGIGCARFDLIPPASSVVASHPAAFGRRLMRATDVLERLHRMDPLAEVTILASGDAVDIALALEQLSRPRGSHARDEQRPAWPVLRSLLLVTPAASDDEAWRDKQASDLARAVFHDERIVTEPATGVTRRLRRRLGL